MDKSIVGASLLVAGLGLSACSTVSFAPPPVNIANEMEVEGSNVWYSRRCMPEQKLRSDNPIPIEKNAEGAVVLTNNFIYYYRCASHSAANGRQAFEIPAFLSLVGTATAAALGAGPTVAIAGGAANAALDGAKDYYSPTEKAGIYDSALDAFPCIKSTASGVEPFVVSGQNALPTPGAAAAGTKPAHFSPERQFYELVSSSLFTVERIAADRIRRTGRYDPAGVVAQITTLTEDVKAAESATSQNTNRASATQMVDPNGKPPAQVAAQTQAVAVAIGSLDALHPKLELCILRAKL